MQTGRLRGRALGRTEEFLRSRGLRMEEEPEYTVNLLIDDDIAATGSLSGEVLKYIAVSEAAEGEGACARVVSELVSEARRHGRRRLFLYTKPENTELFSSLGFYLLARSSDMAVLENRRDGLEGFLASLPRIQGRTGAVVMNADPFTLGHQYLLEQAAAEVDGLYVFVVSEERGRFTPAQRYDMVKAGAAHIPGAVVCQTGGYMVSCATFPAYFIKDSIRAEDARAELDVALFATRIAPGLNITRRFVGSEPYCPVTRKYNALMAAELPRYGIELTELPRKGGISAGRVRAALERGDMEAAREMLPGSSYDYIRSIT